RLPIAGGQGIAREIESKQSVGRLIRTEPPPGPRSRDGPSNAGVFFMAIKDLENDRTHQVGVGRRKEDLKPPKEKALPRVRFTGQQPGEEGVEKDEDPGPDDDKD